MALTIVPSGMTFEHYMAGKSMLQHVLHDIESTIGSEPKWVTCRLNKSDTTEAKAFFLGWVENDALKAVRAAANQPDPGLFRFLDAVHGKTYTEVLKNPTEVLPQDWRNKGLVAEEFLKPLRLYLAAGYYELQQNNEIARRSVAIRVNDRYVGTLNTGLSVDPGKKLDSKLLSWAQSPTSELVQYVRNEFVLGGPFANAANRKRNATTKKNKGSRR